MTLVYTDNGSEYINDGVMESIRFDREAQKVYITPCNDPEHSVREITNVQQVIYNVHAEPRAINDSCQEILDLRNAIQEQDKKYKSLEKSNIILRAYNRKLFNEAPDLYDKFYEEIHQEFKEYFDEQEYESKPSD